MFRKVDGSAETRVHTHTERKMTRLIDCDRNNDGCDGGYIHNALAYIQQYGTPTSSDYPYVAAKGACKGNIRSHASITDFILADKRRLEEHLLVSPIPTVMHARPELQYYVSGVYDSDDCPNDLNKVNHGVVIVGHYADAWILRDSQPGAWGQQGHLLMKKGICAIGEASYELRGPYVVPPPRKKFRLLSREKSQGS
ncbi:uncharacterized protein [Bemisia tabaci]|uniref:uncharacterized protein isoform X2 n=1 Tax=Bemisia tabaci TaxID=7038 RepID=UPI003B27B502